MKIAKSHPKPPPLLENPKILMLSFVESWIVVVFYAVIVVVADIIIITIAVVVVIAVAAVAVLVLLNVFRMNIARSRRIHNHAISPMKRGSSINVCSYSMFNRQSFQYNFIEFPFAIETCQCVCVAANGTQYSSRNRAVH